MATLTSTKIKNTYDALLKSIDNDAIGSTAKQITDGLGNTTPLYVSTTQVGIGVTPESGLNLHVYGDAKIGSNLTVIGNLVVEGSTTTVGTDTLTVKDPLIVLANNNTSTDAVDIGFYGKYTPAGTTLYSGLFREALTGKYRLFKGLQIEPTTTVSISGTGYDKADLVIGNIETNGVVEDSSLFTFSKDVIINKAGTTKLTIDNVTQNKSIELECTSLNNVLNAEGDMIFSSGSPIFKYTSSSFEVLNVDSTFGGDITVSTGTEGGAIFLGSSGSIFSEEGITFKDTDTTIQNVVAGGDIVFKTKTGAGSENTHLTLFEDGTSTFGGQVTIPLTPSANTDAASKGYVDANITAQDLDFSGDSGTGSVDLDSQTFALVGTANEIETSAGNQQLQIGLPTNVTIGGAMTVGDDVIVSGNITLVDKTTSEVGSILLGDGNDLQIFHDGSNSFVSDSGAGDLILRSNSTAIIKSDTTKIQAFGSSTDFVTISSSGSTFAGNVLIGTNINSSIGLQVNQSLGSGNAIGFFRNSASSDGNGLVVDVTNTPSNYLADFRIGNSSKVRIDTEGNVGIGDDSPGQQLTLSNSSSSKIQIKGHSASNGLFLGMDSAVNAQLWNVENGYIRFATNDTERMRLQTSGSTIQDVTLQLKTTGASDNAGIMFINSGNTSSFNDIAGIASFVESGSAKGNLQFWTRNSDGDNSDVAPRLTIDSSGNVGIGISPSKKLTVFGTGAGNATVQIEGEGGADPYINFLANNAQHWSLGVDDSDSDKFKLSEHSALGTNDYFVVDTSGNSTFAGSTLFTNGAAFAGAASIRQQSNYLILTGGSNGFNFNNDDNSATNLKIDSDGNVGIGTDSPAEKLHIVGDGDRIEISSADYDLVKIGAFGTGGADIDNGFFNLLTNGSEKIRLLANGTSYFNGGNVGIGTDDPDAKLQVQGNVKVGSASGASWTDAKDDVGGLDVFVGSGGYALQLWDDNDQTNPRFVVERAGNVGIGVSSLQSWARLQVAGTAGAQTGANQALYVSAPSTTAGEGVGIRLSAASGSNEAVGVIGMVNNASGNAGSMTFHTYNGGEDIPERMRIDSSGNVGIGVTPTAKLMVKDSSDSGFDSGIAIIRSANSQTGYINMVGGAMNFNSPSIPITFRQSGTERMRITSGGRVTINNKPNSGLGYAVLIDVGTGATGDVGYQTLSQLNTNLAGASDIRFKKNIEIIPNAIEKIKTINGYTFDWDSENEDYNYSEKEGRDAGVIAQEIQKVLPEIVQIATVDRDEEGKSTSGKNYLSVDYKKIIPLLIQGIKEQETSIQELKAEIDDLKNKCNCK